MFFSFLLLRRHSFQVSSYLHKATLHSIFLSKIHPSKPYSSLSSDTNTSSEQPKPSSLSARMSFVFDQIDAIEKERSQKDETLQRICTWREYKRNKTNENDNNTSSNSSSEVKTQLGLGSADSNSKDSNLNDLKGGGLVSKAVELVHLWPEWIELMERLVQQNYFDHRRKDENKMIEDLGFDMSDIAEEGFDFTRDWKTVQTACLKLRRKGLILL